MEVKKLLKKINYICSLQSPDDKNHSVCTNCPLNKFKEIDCIYCGSASQVNDNEKKLDEFIQTIENFEEKIESINKPAMATLPKLKYVQEAASNGGLDPKVVQVVYHIIKQLMPISEECN